MNINLGELVRDGLISGFLTAFQALVDVAHDNMTSIVLFLAAVIGLKIGDMLAERTL